MKKGNNFLEIIISKINPFITYGARWIDTDRAGIFAFWRNDGAPWYVCGFRAVVCPI